MSANSLSVFVRAVTVLVAFLLAASVWAEGPRMVAEVEERFEINGKVYGPGTLTVRRVSDLNPGATLTEVWVEQDCLGLFVASEVIGDAEHESGAFFFDRRTDGQLEWVGFALRHHGDRHFRRFSVRAYGVTGRLEQAAKDRPQGGRVAL